MDEKEPGIWPGVNPAHLHWAIIHACKQYGLDTTIPEDAGDPSVAELLYALRRDQGPGSGWGTLRWMKGVDHDG